MSRASALKLKWMIYFSFSLAGLVMIVLLAVPTFEAYVQTGESELVVKLWQSNTVFKVKLERNADLSEAAKKYELHEAVELAEPSVVYKIAVQPTDTLFTRQDYLMQINAPRAWDVVREARDITIAILDTGVDIDHLDLRDNIWVNEDEIPLNGVDDDRNGYIDDVNGWDFITGAPDPRPKFNTGYTNVAMHHGTIVAGVAGAKGGNGAGVTGVAWRVRLMPLRVLDATGQGETGGVSQALNYAVRNGADIINMSFVGESPSQILAASLEDAYNSDVLVVVAAGNEQGEGVDTSEEPRYPVCHDGNKNWVMGVTSVDGINKRTSFANYGRCVDISAPGVGIFSTLFTAPGRGEFGRLYGGGWGGTSLSAPQVAGAAALIKAMNPSLTVAELQRRLLASTDSTDRANPRLVGRFGSGRLNLFKAVSAATAATQTKPRAATKASARQPTRQLIATGAGPGGGPHVRVFTSQGLLAGQFFAADSDFTGGINVALADFEGDGRLEVVVAPESNAQPWVRVFTPSGQLLQDFLAYKQEFTAGLQVAVGDVDGDGEPEIITAPNTGGTAQIKVYSATGELENFFFAYGEIFRGGINLAVGDVDGDLLDEIVTVPASQASPQLKIFSGSGFLERVWLAFDPQHYNGLRVGVIGSNIIVASESGAQSRIMTYDWRGRSQHEWLAYNQHFMGGVRVAAADLDNDGIPEIVATPGRRGGPHLRIFGIRGTLKKQWMAYNPGFRGGVSVSVAR